LIQDFHHALARPDDPERVHLLCQAASNIFLFRVVSRDAVPEDQIVDELISLAEATDSRSTACGAPSVLVRTHAIAQSTAEFLMGEWKENHSPWRS